MKNGYSVSQLLCQTVWNQADRSFSLCIGMTSPGYLVCDCRLDCCTLLTAGLWKQDPLLWITMKTHFQSQLQTDAQSHYYIITPKSAPGRQSCMKVIILSWTRKFILILKTVWQSDLNFKVSCGVSLVNKQNYVFLFSEDCYRHIVTLICRLPSPSFGSAEQREIGSRKLDCILLHTCIWRWTQTKREPAHKTDSALLKNDTWEVHLAFSCISRMPPPLITRLVLQTHVPGCRLSYLKLSSTDKDHDMGLKALERARKWGFELRLYCHMNCVHLTARQVNHLEVKYIPHLICAVKTNS